MRTQTLGEAIVARADAQRRRNRIEISEPSPDGTSRPAASPVALMADHMREIEAARGSVTEADLALRGWTTSEILEHGAAASRSAAAASQRAA